MLFFFTFSDAASSPLVSIKTISKTYPGLRDNNKYHHCYFCGKMVLEMARHLEACHADEHEIASLPKKSNSSEIRNKTFEKLRNLGDLQHINILTKKIWNTNNWKKGKVPKTTCRASFVWPNHVNRSTIQI